ncbi:hypothetical protein PIB30_095350, partial [Stylosanthes scabra]|nr:hypothetical protein [Stylosanthes scabra]
MAAFKFLVSLPGGLPKRSKFTCRWILDSSDAEVEKFLDDLLDVKMKKTKLDNLMAMMADPSRMAPRAILSTGRPSTTATAAAAAASAAAASVAAASAFAAGPTPAESSSQVPPAPTASATQKAKKQSAKPERQKKKGKEDNVFDRVLGDDSAWKHEVDPVKVAFPESFNYRKALNAGLTFAPVRKALLKMPPEQLLGESYHLSAKSLACLQIEVLKGERETALAYLPLKEKVDSLGDQLSERTQLESSQLSLEGEKKRSAAAEGHVGSLSASLKTCQADLSKATEAAEYWRAEWQKLGTEVREMCQETLDICLDQVSHLFPGIDFSAITLKSRWDPKGRRIYVPQESDVEEELTQDEEVMRMHLG